MTTSHRPTRRAVTQSLVLGATANVVSGALSIAQGQAPAAAKTPGAEWDVCRGCGFPAGRSRGRGGSTRDDADDGADGRCVRPRLYRYGDIAQASYLASARKSILSMLYGKYVANGTIKLDTTMGELGIDEDDGLLPIEKTARIRDLLIASSGVYHKAGSPGDDPKTPERGSQQPGAHFHYNNWDFNVLGAVFEKLTGKTVFAALEQDLAGRSAFQDFDAHAPAHDGIPEPVALSRLSPVPVGARHGAARSPDGARRKLERPAAHAGGMGQGEHEAARDGGAAGRGGELGYAYLWWIPETRTGPEWAGSFMASGQFGQYILVLPAIDTVIVHRRAVTDEYAIARNLGKTQFYPQPVTASEFLKVADMIVAARTG